MVADPAGIQWKVDRQPGGGGSSFDVWTLGPDAGAIEASRDGGTLLSGKASIERFLPKTDSEGRLWPREFNVNPWTGERLQPALTERAPSRGRFGSPSGVPSLDVDYRSIKLEAPQPEILDPGSYFFALGGRPGFLFAVDQNLGVAYRRSRLTGEWVLQGRCYRSPLPSWSNGVIGTPEGVFYSAAGGLVRIDEDPGDSGPELMELGAMVSAPVLIDNSIAVPFIEGGELCVALRTEEGGVRKIKVHSSVSFKGHLSTPATDFGKTVYWTAANGYLAFELDRGKPHGVWKTWPPEFEAAPWLRPYQSPTGSLWAMGLLKEEGAAVAGRPAVCELRLGEGASAIHMLDGPHLSAGASTYRVLGRHQKPWSEPVDQVQPGLDMSDRWVMPIAGMGGGGCIVALVDGQSSMRAFVYREGRARSRIASVFMHRPNAGLVTMDFSFELNQIDDLEFFGDGDFVYIYCKSSNECARWSISEADGRGEN
jgi:hypothetical protein